MFTHDGPILSVHGHDRFHEGMELRPRELLFHQPEHPSHMNKKVAPDILQCSLPARPETPWHGGPPPTRTTPTLLYLAAHVCTISSVMFSTLPTSSASGKLLSRTRFPAPDLRAHMASHG
jgi:hypothetical protein